MVHYLTSVGRFKAQEQSIEPSSFPEAGMGGATHKLMTSRHVGRAPEMEEAMLLPIIRSATYFSILPLSRNLMSSCISLAL